jgi:hypothetical protein
MNDLLHGPSETNICNAVSATDELNTFLEIQMNWSEMKTGWSELKAVAQSQWPRLTDVVLRDVNGDRAELARASTPLRL